MKSVSIPAKLQRLGGRVNAVMDSFQTPLLHVPCRPDHCCSRHRTHILCTVHEENIQQVGAYHL